MRPPVAGAPAQHGLLPVSDTLIAEIGNDLGETQFNFSETIFRGIDVL